MTVSSIRVLIASVIVLVFGGTAMVGTARAEVTLHLSKKEIVKGDKVKFTIDGTEKGATYLLKLGTQTLASGTDPDGGKVTDKFKMPDWGSSSTKVEVQVRVTQGGALWLDSRKFTYLPVAPPPTVSKPKPPLETQSAPQPTPQPSPVQSQPAPTTPSTPVPSRSTIPRQRQSSAPSTNQPKLRSQRSPSPSPAAIRRASPPSTAKKAAPASRPLTPVVKASPARDFAIPIWVVAVVGAFTLLAIAGAEARLVGSPAQVGTTPREAELARLRALERAAERAI